MPSVSPYNIQGCSRKKWLLHIIYYTSNIASSLSFNKDDFIYIHIPQVNVLLCCHSLMFHSDSGVKRVSSLILKDIIVILMTKMRHFNLGRFVVVYVLITSTCSASKLCSQNIVFVSNSVSLRRHIFYVHNYNYIIILQLITTMIIVNKLIIEIAHTISALSSVVRRN